MPYNPSVNNQAILPKDLMVKPFTNIDYPPRFQYPHHMHEQIALSSCWNVLGVGRGLACM